MVYQIARPAGPATYVMPGSHALDPPYSWQLSRTWPLPRAPSEFESESRAPGTGMISGRGPPASEIAGLLTSVPQRALPPPSVSLIEQPTELLQPMTE